MKSTVDRYELINLIERLRQESIDSYSEYINNNPTDKNRRAIILNAELSILHNLEYQLKDI